MFSKCRRWPNCFLKQTKWCFILRVIFPSEVEIAINVWPNNENKNIFHSDNLLEKKKKFFKMWGEKECIRKSHKDSETQT